MKQWCEPMLQAN